MSGSNGGLTRSSTVTRRADSRVKRTDAQARQTPREEKQFARPTIRGYDAKWRPISRSTPCKLKRSISLIAINQKLSSGGESSVSTASSETTEEDKLNTLKQDVLRWKVLYTFSRNLCRTRKEQMELMLKEQDKSDEATSKLSIQVSLLKSILRSDETIRETWKKRLQDVKLILTSALKENTKLKEDFEEISENMEKMKEKISRLETENNNYKNTQIFLKSECSAFEQQLKKERDSNALIKYDSQIQTNKLNSELDKKSEENKILRNQMEEYESCLEDKSFTLAEMECNLQNTTRVWQNSLKEIQQLKKEAFELRRANKLLKEEVISVKSSMCLLENNQQQIYKYFNMNIA